MKKEFLPYDLEVKLVELGFNEKTFDVHSDIITQGFKVVKKPTPRILFQQAFRFFDDNTDYKGFIVPSIKEECFYWEIYHDGNKILECSEYYSLRKNAEIECIKKLIEIAKEQNVK